MHYQTRNPFGLNSGENFSNCGEDVDAGDDADSPLNGTMDGQGSVESGGDTDGGGSSPKLTADGDDTITAGNKRKVPKVFPKEAVTKFRTWLFNNLTVN